MFNAILRILIYVLVVILPVIGVTFLTGETEGLVHELARNTSLAAFMILVLQVVLAARIKWIERPFGLDILLRFHKYMAVTALVLLLSHPLLMAVSAKSPDLLISLRQPWYIWLGKITLLLLLLNIGLSLYQSKLKLKFENWRQVHDILAPAIIILAFTHSIVIGDDLHQLWLRGFWIALLIVALSVYIWHRIIRPIILKRRAWEVVEVNQESRDVWTVKLAPPQGSQIFEYFPGQFQFITFYRDRNLPLEEHHWTISSSPAQKDYVASTIKNLGDFTSTIKDTRPGDKAAVHGPFGRFSYALHPEETDLVFIAGGIGITPLMSMLRHMRDMQDNRSVLLLYGNPDTEQIVFRRELEEIESGANPRLQVVHVLSAPDENWEGEQGRIDGDKIAKYIGRDLSGKVFYICGPPPMIQGTVSVLENMGVHHGQIRIEIFSFLD